MDLRALESFVKVVQSGSFTRAAEVLKSQKAHLSRVVSQLEADLGVRLLERTTRSLSLTEVGREFFERAQGILASVGDAQLAVQRAKGKPHGTLKLTCGVDFGMIAVCHWIRAYLERYPQVRLDADYTSRLVDIVHEGFDLAIRVGPLADSTLVARRLGDLSYGLFAAPHYLAQHGAPAHPDQLRAHPALVFAGGSHLATWTLAQTGSPPIRVELRPRLKANNVFVVRDAAVSGLGLARLPWIVAMPTLKEGRLQQVLPGWTLPAVPVHALFASARYLTPKVRAFVDLAVAAMRDQ